MTGSTKNFRKRNAILAYLRETTEHPSAEMIFNRLKPEIADLSIGTVYRNLALFQQQGLVSSIATVNGVERYDGNTATHVHFICSCCDSVIDLHELEMPESLRNAAEESAGCKVESCQLSFTGICRECLTKQVPGSETA